MFGPIGATELIIILVLALIIFGPGKLPDVGRAVGRSIKEFKRASSALEDDVNGVGGREEKPGQISGAGSDSKQQPPSESKPT